MDKILGLTIGEPFDLKSWSGSSFNFFSSLRSNNKLLDVFNVDLNKRQKFLYAIPHLSFNRTKLRQKYLIHPLTFRKRSAIATSIAREYEDADVIMQIGAMFKVNSDSKPIVAYCDGNLAISKDSNRSFTEFVPQHILKKAFENEKSVYEKCSLIFTFSEWLRKSMVRDFELPENKVFAIGAGPNISLTEALEEKKGYDQKTILFIGKDFYRKGGDTVIKAFYIASKEIKDIKLIIAGTNPIHGVEARNIEFTGYIDKNTNEGRKKIIDLYKRASVFVMPSVFEPFGIVFLEAMLFKLPCVGSSICAMPEIIDEDNTGFLINPGDAEALAEKLIILLKDEAMLKKMGENGFERVMTQYTWDNVVSKIDILLNKIA